MKSYIGPKAILEKKKKYIMPCLAHFFQDPPEFVKGSMQYLFDTEGKKYLDCFAGVSVINCGHCNPEITQKVVEQVQSLQHVCNIYLTENFVNLAEKLAEVTPGKLQKSFFCSTGSEANEGALLLATIYTKSSEFIALRNGLHGRTKLGMSVTGIGMWRTDPNPCGGISFAPNPYCYRCPLGKKYPECDLECANQIEDIIKTATSGNPAAFIAESIQGNAGIVVPPKGYFKRVKEILEKYNTLLIIDEVQTGFARTGKMFAIENFDVEPDIMTMAKALGNGAPISAFIASAKIADTYTRPGASTLGGNPVSSAAGLAVLSYIEEHNLLQNAYDRGVQLREGLAELAKKHPIIGDIRGLGLMNGAEFVHADKSPAFNELDEVLEEMKNRGFIIGKNGISRNVMAFQPPLVITEENINDVLNNLDDVLTNKKL
ncbi:aspartate aminotransferase family protein [Schwartzia succinivorans]|jgi:4-aminobutyrate aminotransferase|uniref:alanine--glyoxylate transaminase n=1 Tax=Schwartzia succinivorans DSM 10502 TaxID=1123243 RepID=A0A1M4VZ38_9FIRM|nr:aspartate aminotransferase family protein [Schwartzia succinivorans]SHE74226.1 4-aminobutyrate aminotransferase [Schwartzia succinivorans DSM 10502]